MGEEEDIPADLDDYGEALDEMEEEEEETSSEQGPLQDDVAEKRRQYRISRYRKRFGQVSKSGGFELEEEESEIDEKGEEKITEEGVLRGGKILFLKRGHLIFTQT